MGTSLMNAFCGERSNSKFSLQGLNYRVELDLDSNRTFVYGNSGNGKSFLYDVLYEYSDEYPIKCFDYHDVNKRFSMKSFIEESEGFLIVIDNDDVLLDDEMRKIVSLDQKNRYLIFGSVTEGLFIRMNRVKGIVVKDGVITLMNYLDAKRAESAVDE